MYIMLCPKSHVDKFYVKRKGGGEIVIVAEFRNKNMQKTSLSILLEATTTINQR
jgi:hypothetical protein